MNSLANFVLILAAVLFGSACSLSQPVLIGDSEAQVLAARGKPPHRYQIDNEQLLEYNYGPFGQQTYLARLDAQGKVMSFEQVLKAEKFESLQIGKATKQDVLHTIGMPSEQTYLPLPRFEVWSYPYRQHGWIDAIMHVHFDQAGIVQKMVNTPDHRFSGRNGNVFGAFWR